MINPHLSASGCDVFFFFLKGCKVVDTAAAACVEPVYSFLHVWHRAQAEWEEVSLNTQGRFFLMLTSGNKEMNNNSNNNKNERGELPKHNKCIKLGQLPAYAVSVKSILTHYYY